MRKPIYLLGTALATVAIVGGTGAAASAQGFDHHRFGDGHSFGSFASGGSSTFGSGDRGFAPSSGFRRDPGAGFDRAGRFGAGDPAARPGGTFGSGRFDGGRFDGPGLASDRRGPAFDRSGPGFGDRFRHFRAPVAPPTFAERQAAVVAGLTAADDRLTALVNRLTADEASDPTGPASKILPFITQAQTRVESLLAQAQAATTDAQLDAVIAQLWRPWMTAPVAP